jgi:hypothetical protein
MANADIFQRDATIGDPFSADDSELLFRGGQAQTMVVQNLTIRYEQTVTRAWEVGSSKQYFISGHQQGSGSMGRIIGPKPIANEFFRLYGDVCEIQDNTIRFVVKGDCSTNGGSITASGVVITSVEYSVRAQDMVINETVQLLVAKVESA